MYTIRKQGLTFLPLVQSISHYRSHNTPQNMGKVRYVVGQEQAFVNLLSDEDYRHKYNSNGYFTFPETGKRSQEYEGENHTAGTAKGDVGEDYVVHNRRNHRRDSHYFKYLLIPVLLFKHGTQKKNIGHVSDIVRPPRMAQNMGKEPYISKGRSQRRMISHKEQFIACPRRQKIDYKGYKANGRKRKNNRRIKGNAYMFLHAVSVDI